MGEARRSRRGVPPGPPLRHGRDDRQPHLDPGAGRGQRLPHQSLRHALRADARLVLHQARPRRQDPVQSHRVRHQQGGLHHPQRDPPRAPRGRLRHPLPHDRGHGRLGDESRADAARADGDALHRHRLPRLRGRRDRDGRAGAPGARPGKPRGDDPQEPRAAGGRREHSPGIRQHLPPGARLPAAGDDARLQHRDLSPAAQDHRGRIAPLSARGAPQARPARMAGADQEARLDRSVVPRVAAIPAELDEDSPGNERQMLTHTRCSGLAAALMLACVPCHAADGSIAAIVGATVIHPDRDLPSAVASNSTLIIAGRRIESIGPASSTPVPAGARLIDGKGKWVVPGLIDSHIHFFQSGNLYTRPDVADFNKWMPYSKEVERNKARLPATFKVWLASGVTGAGPLISMVDRVKLDLGDPPIIKAASADEARALVRRELERKPDFIKVWFIHRQGDDLAAQEAIVKAAADAAHAAGVRLAVHATELIVAKASLRVGADFLVHSVEDEAVDEEFLALAKNNRALYCPTLFVTLGYRYALSNTWRPTETERRLADPQILAAMNDLRKIPKETLPERVAKAMNQPVPPEPSAIALQNLRKVWDAGIPVVMGTDAGNIGTLHGPSVFREMEIMTRAGLAPLQVLRSATSNGAKAMAMEREIGTLAPGKLADLVILDADPLANVMNLGQIHRVIKDGRIFVPDELIRSIAARR